MGRIWFWTFALTGSGVLSTEAYFQLEYLVYVQIISNWVCPTKTANDIKRLTAPPFAEVKWLHGSNLPLFFCFQCCANVATKQTCCFPVSGWGEGQGPALVSSLLLSAAGPGENTDQKWKGLVLKEKETERNFSHQTEVVKPMTVSVHRFIVQISFFSPLRVLHYIKICKSLWNVSIFIKINEISRHTWVCSLTLHAEMWQCGGARPCYFFCCLHFCVFVLRHSWLPPLSLSKHIEGS